MRSLILGLALLAGPLAAQTVAGPGTVKPKPSLGPIEVARGAPVNGVLVLYGNQRCPTNTDGDEIVVCERRSASEQFRVPKELREFQVTPQNEAWAQRAQGLTDGSLGPNGIGTCSVVGPGGQTGCFAQSVRADRRENAARKVEDSRAP